MVPILKMRRFSCLLRLLLPPEIWEMAQIFMSDRFVDVSIPYGAKMFGKSVGKASSRFSNVEQTTSTARNAVNEVGEDTCETMSNNKIRFWPRNACRGVEKRTRVAAGPRTRKSTRWRRKILSKGAMD